MTLWTTACQVPPSIGFSRQEYWSGLPFPTPRDLSNLGIKTTPLTSTCTGRRVLYHYLGSPTKPALAPKFICSIAIPLLWLCLSRSYSQRQTIILREPFKPIEIVLEFFNNITIIIIAMILVNVSFYTGNCALNKTLSQLRHEPYWRNVSNIIFILKDSVYITDFKNTMITHEKFPQCW